MSCFMGYNPLVAKEVKITTWIKEFDGDSPVYPSFPNEGDCFVVFATDEDALTHNALSKKTYTNGEWADAEGGGGGDSDFITATLTVVNSSVPLSIPTTLIVAEYDLEGSFGTSALQSSPYTIILYKGKAYLPFENVVNTSGDITYDEDLGIYIMTGDCSVEFGGLS